MEVILLENVPALGKAGDIVQVAVGYGRNFLIPKKLAMEATPQNMRIWEQQRKIFLQKKGKELERAREEAQRIESISFTLRRTAGESEKLFGSVTSLDLQKALHEQGIVVDRKRILLPHPLKKLGSYSIPIKLHPEVTAQMNIQIVADTTPDSGNKA
ncbi:MAG: 50S ribosomal protein L9 [Thermodesulfobacteriota bacterium]